jgi:hypothetical protein
MRRLVLVAVAIAGLLVSAAPADAGSRSSAQRFADAALRTKVRIGAVVPAVKRSAREIWEPCAGLPESEPPARAKPQIDVLEVSIILGPVFPHTQPVLERFVADLEAIPTNDPALRSGRAAWRESVRREAAIPIVERPCELYAAWAATGYAPEAAPVLPVAEYEAAMRGLDELEARSARKKDRAARRLRRLGVREPSARRFAGAGMFRALDDAFPGDH